MATRVVSIAGSRAALRQAEETARRSSRLTVALLIPVGLLAVIGLGAILSASSSLLKYCVPTGRKTPSTPSTLPSGALNGCFTT